MPISRRAAAVLAAAALAALAAAADPASLGDLLDAAPPGSVRQMDREELDRLLAYGESSGLTIFEVFNEAIVALAAGGQKVTVSGDLLRDATQRFDLGGDRVASLLPVAKVAQVSLGSSGTGAPGELEVLLREEHAQYLELGDIRLSTRYGFRDVRPGLFADGFGASVRRFVFSFNLESMELYDRNKVAIHVRSLAQPKRWRIPRITSK